MAFAATWMDPEILILSEVSQTVTVQCDVAYVWNLKKKTNHNNRNGLRCLRERIYGYQRGRRAGRDRLGV